MSALFEYAKSLVGRSGFAFGLGDVFAKVLTANDDSGRHGVLIPTDAYEFFPKFEIMDPTANQTTTFQAFDAVSGGRKTLAYKYYERYPERRVTRLPNSINETSGGHRMLVVVRTHHPDRGDAYCCDVVPASEAARFQLMFEMIFGDAVAVASGAFIVRPIEGATLAIDAALGELLARFDAVHHMGWVDSRRAGDTGVGHTFESLIGVKENNDKRADFSGIEIKCKRSRGGGKASASKMNLFQEAPTWMIGATMKDRIRAIGVRGDDGLYRCHSQVSPRGNNIGLRLDVRDPARAIFLQRRDEDIGRWTWSALEQRLTEKHSRLVVVKASTMRIPSGDRFRYDELIYCERPDIGRFLSLVREAGIVFEFLMSEKKDAPVRNHGYPWRLTREDLLDSLFRLRVQLRAKAN